MSRIEKFAFWAAIISLIFFVLSLFGIFSFRYWATSEIVKSSLNESLVRLFSSYIPEIVFGVWLYYEAGQKKLSKVTWSLFGLAFGIYGVALFYILLAYFNILAIRKKLLNET
jgi:hypothetical protein